MTVTLSRCLWYVIIFQNISRPGKYIFKFQDFCRIFLSVETLDEDQSEQQTKDAGLMFPRTGQIFAFSPQLAPWAVVSCHFPHWNSVTGCTGESATLAFWKPPCEVRCRQTGCRADPASLRNVGLFLSYCAGVQMAGLGYITAQMQTDVQINELELLAKLEVRQEWQRTNQNNDLTVSASREDRRPLVWNSEFLCGDKENWLHFNVNVSKRQEL